MLPLQSFIDFISQNNLFTPQGRVLLAVSGGKDSVLMTHLFKLAGYEFGIAHCNFNLRADESQRDESFVKMLAATLSVPFYVTHFKTKDYAAEHKVSTQMAARILRYEWFEEIRQIHNYDAIALAQHQDDAIETVLLNLTRGTGIAGLHGILPKRGKLIRPLLFMSRKDIDGLIDENDLDFVEDSSNLTANYARNKIRLNVIPQLKEINPNLEHTFEHNIQRFSDTELVLQNVVAALKQELFIEKQHGIYISIAKINALVPQKLLCFELLRTFGFTESIVSDLLHALGKQSGTCFYSTTHRLIIDREYLIVSVFNTEETPIAFIHTHDAGVRTLQQEILVTYSGTPFFEKTMAKAFVDADLLIYPLIVRTRQDGDHFMPMGMSTFKKLSNFFIDEKVPLNEKEVTPILINGNGEVIWIAGLRQDNRYKVTSTTKKLAIFELKKDMGTMQSKNK
ncbi:tRNA lysidine(34) synthetase TilS [Pedobacter metabolipauper]|uniref:tRNA(Ile)-lysidine synthase n=1 Tax=Pedobacter metabolipauper TaxID=425513 RepID=A0A4R6SUB5_9SPHI|nr:tRNA lysidine(34) synthetase TilS [Pedobacter metabolipauper]TDQ07674.1 tRNA(Ile)-lysidine synthase [Pedobacter metabolipauper]